MTQYQTQLTPANAGWRVGDIIEFNYRVIGFVGVDFTGTVITETVEMYDDAKCIPDVKTVKAVLKEI